MVKGKIVFVVPDMPGGGTERVVALLANEYAARGIAVSSFFLQDIRRPIRWMNVSRWCRWGSLPAAALADE